MTIAIASAVRTAMADALGNLPNSGLLRIYSAAQTDPDSAANGTLLAELTMNADAFAAASDDGTNASITANAITQDSSADATGTAAGFRMTNGAGSTSYLTGTVTATSGGGDMELNNVSIVATGTVSCSSAVLRVPQ